MKKKTKTNKNKKNPFFSKKNVISSFILSYSHVMEARVLFYAAQIALITSMKVFNAENVVNLSPKYNFSEPNFLDQNP